MAQRAARMSARERRKSILEAARKVFSKLSYRQATTLDVAQEAGISQPALFKYFPSKRELFLEVLATVDLEGDAVLTEQQNTSDALQQWCRLCFERSGGFFQMLRMALHAVSESEDIEIAHRIGAICTKRQQQLQSLIASAQESGEFSGKMPPAFGAWMMLSLGLLSHIATITGMETFGSTEVESLSQLYLEMMR